MIFKRNGKIVTALCVTALAAGVAAYGFFFGDDNEYFLNIYNGIDTFTRVYKDVAANYVDQINPELFMRAGIDGMLKTLDPYTTFIGEKEGDEIDLVTSGKYGGIGITIGARDGYVTVVGLIERIFRRKTRHRSRRSDYRSRREKRYRSIDRGCSAACARHAGNAHSIDN